MPIFSISNVSSGNFPTKVTTWNTPAQVAASTTAVALIGSNSNRTGLTITNNSDATLYLKFAALATTAATTLNYDRIVPPKSVFEFPANEIPTSAINGIWVGTVTGGHASVTESAA